MSAASTDPVSMLDVVKRDGPKQFHRKLERLISGLVKTDLDEASNLPRGSVSTYLVRHTIPQPHAALKLLRGLEKMGRGVPLSWLIDEDDETLDPPKYPLVDLSKLPLHLLMSDVGRRYLPVALEANELIQRFAVTDWKQLAEIIIRKAESQELDATEERVFRDYRRLSAINLEISEFDVADEAEEWAVGANPFSTPNIPSPDVLHSKLLKITRADSESTFDLIDGVLTSLDLYQTAKTPGNKRFHKQGLEDSIEALKTEISDA